MNYTHERFLEELKKTYQLTKKEDGSFDFKAQGYVQLEIAEQLSVGQTNFSKMLHDSYSGRYNYIINMLIKQREIFALEKQIEELNESSSKQLELQDSKNTKTHSIKLQYFFLGLFLAFTASVAFFFYNTNSQKSIISKTSERRLIRLIETRNSYQLTIGLLLFKDKLQRGKIDNTNMKAEIVKLYNNSEKILNENRHQLEDMELYTEGGINFAEIAEKTYSLEQRRKAFDSFIPILESPKYNLENIVSAVENIADIEQTKIEKRVDTLLNK